MTTPAPTTDRVVAVLRQSALAGSDRPVSPDETLGAGGVGLDSLGLTEFIVALEGEFGMQFPDEFWTSRGRLTLADIVAEVERRDGPRARLTHSPRRRDLAKTLGRMIRRGLRRVFRRKRQVLLAIDLRRRALPAGEDRGFTYRQAVPDDLEALAGFWGPADQPRWNRVFVERLEQGLRCFVAVHEGRIVAIDWVAEGQAEAPAIGLRIGIGSGSSYGMNLTEHRSFRDRGAGLGLLAHVLRESAGSGLIRQVTLVDEANVRMLGASIQLLGFETIGGVETVWLFGRPFTRWRSDGRSGWGGTLHV